MSKELKCITIIKESLETHITWAEFFEKKPELEHHPQYVKLGDGKFHRECIKNYSEAIVEIELLIAKAGNEELITDIESLYCPSCEKTVMKSEVVYSLHTCGFKVVPLYSEERRKRLRAEERIAELEAEMVEGEAHIDHLKMSVAGQKDQTDDLETELAETKAKKFREFLKQSEFTASLESQLAKLQWRSVEDELPENGGLYLLTKDFDGSEAGGEDCWLDIFGPGSNGFKCIEDYIDLHEITHWMPISLPAPSGKPKTEGLKIPPGSKFFPCSVNGKTTPFDEQECDKPETEVNK